MYFWLSIVLTKKSKNIVSYITTMDYTSDFTYQAKCLNTTLFGHNTLKIVILVMSVVK